MLKALLRINLAALLNSFFGGSKRNKAAEAKKKKKGTGAKIAYALLLIYVLGIFIWLFGQVFGLLAEPMYLFDSGWLYFVYAFIASFAVMFILNVFAAKNRLYEAKDNDLLLSMPIKPGYILASRMLLLFVLNFGTGILLFGPAVYCWFDVAGFDGATLAACAVLFLALCLFTLALSCLFGWLLSLASARINKKALFETVLSFGFLAVYFYLYIQITDIINGLIANNSAISKSISGISPLVWMGSGALGNIADFILALLVFTVPFVIVYIVLSRTFISTATAKRGSAKVKYEAKETEALPVGRALLKREFSRFFASSIAIMNHGLGAIFLLVAAVALIIYKGSIQGLLGSMPAELGDIFCGAGVLLAGSLAGVSMPSSSSVSLEGKSLWVVRSMPVSSAQVLGAKLRLSLVLFLPAVAVFMLSLIFVLQPSSELIPLMLLAPLAISTVMAELGLIFNLKHPMLEWTTESQPVKSGISVLLSMLSNFGMLAVCGFGGYFALDGGISIEVTLGVILAVFLITARLLYGFIMGKGAAIFDSL